MKILVTGGGSEEPIDNVRAICNFSTGRTASFLADFLSSEGFEVTAIMAEKAVKPENAAIITYKTFAQLKAALETECCSGRYDAVIHAAAVSDYSPETIVVDGKEYKAGSFSKVPAGTELIVKMRKNPKLVDSIKMNAGKDCKVIAFKLTSNASIEERKAAVKKIFCSNADISFAPDYVVSNDLSQITKDAHPCTIYNRKMEPAAQVRNLQELAAELAGLIKQN